MALRYLRENLKSLTWILWLTVFGLFIVVFFDWGGYNRRAAGSADVAATVGNETISYREFQQQYRSLEDNYRQAFGDRFNREMIQQFNLPKQALDRLIDRRILLIEARNIGLEATDAEVREAILAQPVFQDEDGRFIGDEEYRRILRANRLSIEDFESSMREDVLIGKLNAVLTETSFVSDEAVERAYRDQNERARIRYVRLPASEFDDLVAQPSDVEAYFAEHQDDYKLPEQRVADSLLIDTVQLRREIEIPEQELQAYYDDNRSEFDREEQVRARHILFKVTPDRPEAQAQADLLDVRRRIESGEDFAALARELSEDEVSASRGGSLGFFGRGQMIKAFEDAAWDAEIGELVGPVKTDFGFHLLEVQEFRAGGVPPFEDVEAAVRARLVGERVNEIAAAKAQDVAQRLETPTPEDRQAVAEGGDLMAVLAEKEGLVFKTTEPFGQGDAITGIGRSPELLRAAFELEVGEVTEAIKVPRGWVLLRLKEVIPPRVPELVDVAAEVREAAEQALRSSAALERLQEARAALEAGGDLYALAEELGLEVQESAEFGRYGTIAELGQSRQIIARALELEEGQWSDPIAIDDGAVLFEVSERKTFDAAEFEDAKASARRSQETQRFNQLLASLIELRKRDLTPSYDPQVFESFGESSGV